MSPLGHLFVLNLLVFSCSFPWVASNEHHLAKRALLFPQYTVLQFTYGVSAPAILPSRTINLSVAVQSNWDLPYNLTNFQIVTYARSSQDDADLNRKTLYEYIIDILDGIGLDGKECLLRSVCEAAHTPFDMEQEDSVMEKIVHFVLTPSLEFSNDITSTGANDTENFQNELVWAEITGRNNENCRSAYSNCVLSVLDLMSSRYRMF